MPTVNLSTGINTYYQIEGVGDILLLIMGTGADHSTWNAQVKCYRNHFTVVSYDNRGTGQSTHPSTLSDYSMRILTDDAAAVLEHVCHHRPGFATGDSLHHDFSLWIK